MATQLEKQEPTNDLLNLVKAGFVQQGITLNTFCKQNHLDSGNTHRALTGEWSGSKAESLRAFVVNASQSKRQTLKSSAIRTMDRAQKALLKAFMRQKLGDAPDNTMLAKDLFSDLVAEKKEYWAKDPLALCGEMGCRPDDVLMLERNVLAARRVISQPL
jgi:hypothetical protein